MVKSSITLLCKSTSNLKKRKIDETPEQYLKHITHLYLNGKQLDEVGPEISLCKHLNVLYLYDNFLTYIPTFAGLLNLTHLYLQNNNIERIENISTLAKLEKLYLSRNCITVVEGLEGLHSLRELRIDNQKLAPGDHLLFDDDSVISISKTLLKLDVSGNGLRHLHDIISLRKLTFLSAKNNRFTSITDLTSTLVYWPCLKQLELQGNPVLAKPRAKDAIIVSSKALMILDDKPIVETTRRFLENWNEHRGIRLEVSESAMRPTLSPLLPDMDSMRTGISGMTGTSFGMTSGRMLAPSNFESPQGEPALSPMDTAEKHQTAKQVSTSGTTEEIQSIEWLRSSSRIGPSGCGEARTETKQIDDTVANGMNALVIH